MTPGLYSPWDSPGQNTGVGNLFLLQGIFPIQGSNPGLPRCRRILYQLSHQGSPGNTEVMSSLSLLQGIFLTQDQGVLHCRWILYQLSYTRKQSQSLYQEPPHPASSPGHAGHRTSHTQTHLSLQITPATHSTPVPSPLPAASSTPNSTAPES